MSDALIVSRASRAARAFVAIRALAFAFAPFAAALPVLAGCGVVIGLGDHQLFSDAGDLLGGEGAATGGDAAVDAGGACPGPPCGGVCCSYDDNFGGQHTACQASCGFGEYAAACEGPAECEAGTCCATMLAATPRRTQTSSTPPACGGWWFRGSTCGGCAPQTPNYCGQTFQVAMCEKSSDCPFQQSCCRVQAGDLFAYCMNSSTVTALSPSVCLP